MKLLYTFIWAGLVAVFGAVAIEFHAYVLGGALISIALMAIMLAPFFEE